MKKLIILMLKPLTSYCICAYAILFIYSVFIPTNNAAQCQRVFHISFLYRKIRIFNSITHCLLLEKEINCFWSLLFQFNPSNKDVISRED